MKPSSQFWNTNVGKTLKAAAWSAASAVLAYIITATTNDPELFGPMTVFINAALVFVQKTFLSQDTPNI
ncbi:hypothetical protein NG701_07415 [Pseudarthrobacter sp. HLT3-5]|uniref:hypothetical protein n=1 Tax=Pseudarthrobacter cellobiosi TaxID=2953654 RepID=UPI00208EF79F|nr:hypothetical protein [Pseudarthrobacter sp. HLT3-5]MCO4274256.1 hypothetical protein [Pseudarthrobacter sp. HLT3-5]